MPVTLLSNDDGVNAQGLAELYRAINPITECIVVAPDRNNSGRSSALTLNRPLYFTEHNNGFYSVNGTPADCVCLAAHILLDHPPLHIISGINHGANLGDDILYSGTVAAAFEGRFTNDIAFAVSSCSAKPEALQNSALAFGQLFPFLSSYPFPGGTVLNINIPDCPLEEIKGLQITRLGHRARQSTPMATKDPKGRNMYWIPFVGQPADAAKGTDFFAIANNYISITPLSYDQTNHKINPDLQKWQDWRIDC